MSERKKSRPLKSPKDKSRSRARRRKKDLQCDILPKGGGRRTIESSVSLLTTGGTPAGLHAPASDITDREQAEEILHLTNLFLKTANQHSRIQPLLNDFSGIIREFTKCGAIGIRVFDTSKKITDQIYTGFSKKFFESQCLLSNGNDWCLCRIAAEGSRGYFRLDGSPDSSLRLPIGKESGSVPPCKACGYQIVAALPIRVEQRVVGLVQVADRNHQTFQENTAIILERAVSHIGTAIVRIHMNETVRQALQLSHKKADEASALLHGSKAVLEHHNFEHAAEAIISPCRGIIGAAAGCITRKYLTGEFDDDHPQEEVVAFNAKNKMEIRKGGILPIQGVRAAVYTGAKAVFSNLPHASTEMGFIGARIKLRNFLISPILLDKEVGGLLILSNKPGGFSKEDARLAEAFAAQAAVALHNNNSLAALKKSEARYRWLSESLESVVRKKVAELQQAKTLASIGHMVSVVAHEIRNPLQNIYMGVDALRKEIKDDPVKAEILDEVSYGVKMLNGIVQELLDYSKPVTLVRSAWSADEIIGNSLGAIIGKLASVQVRKNLRDADRKIAMDGEKMSRVVVNLITNAIEAMPAGGTLTIASEICACDGKSNLKISVSDTGCGIDEDAMARIEEPFFTTKSQGTGLGISICKKIVEAHDGSLHFHSKKKEGTTVVVLIPAQNQP